MIYRFRLEANKVDSNQSQKLAIPAVVEYLNAGQLNLMKTRYGSNNAYQATLEQIQKRIDEWQKLIVPHKILEGTEDKDNKAYTFKLSEAEAYCFLLRCSFVASKEKCIGQTINNAYYVQTDDLNINFDNPNSNSNFEWREVNYRLAQDLIIAYTDSHFSFSIDKANIDYLRYPVEMDLSGYRHFDGTDSSDIDCELPKFLHPDIVTEGVLLFKAALNHPDLQARQYVKALEE